MATIAKLREQCSVLLTQVEAPPCRDGLRAVYMEMASLMGAIQAAVAQAARERGETSEIEEAQHAMEALRDTARHVGFDIRLASTAALAIGLRTALEHAQQVLNALDSGQ